MSRPIFILSNFRSGSTLLRYVLDTHPSVCCPAELRLAAFCQQAFSVVAATTDEGPVSPERMDRQMAAVRRQVDELMDAYCKRKGKQRWCDKSPANAGALYVLAAVFPDAQYICLHRHALDQVLSTLNVDGPARLQQYLTRQRGTVLAAAIDRWCTVTERLLAFEHAQHGVTRRVIYEAFVERPEEEIADLLGFLDLAAVHGLSVSAFRFPHDHGPGDAKITATRRVERDRMGMGRSLDLRGVPAELRRRLDILLAQLGYSGSPRVSRRIP
jgi:hypothetical protein